MAQLKNRCLAAGAALVCLGAVGAGAASAATVTVRVEGRNTTLLAAKTVHTGTGSITRGGASAGACPATSAQGALAEATRGNWRGSWYSSYNEYYLTGILGLNETGKRWYWGLYVNNRLASTGACDVTLKSGDRVLFAVVPSRGRTPAPLALVTPPARVGFPYTVRVLAYNARGKAHPVAGARVRVAGHTLRSGANGWTRAVRFPAAGRETFTATKPGAVRVESTVVVKAA